jgi:hypothetical protein
MAGESTLSLGKEYGPDQELVQKLRNVHAVNVTPFREDGTIDYVGLAENVRFLLDNGTEVIVPCGNSGEFYALTGWRKPRRWRASWRRMLTAGPRCWSASGTT